MDKYDLSEEEDLRMHLSIMLPGERYLYEYFIELPLEELKVYPKKGYRWWMGRKARSPEALALRDYILHWRLVALDFREKYSWEYLQLLSSEEKLSFLRTYLEKTPIWVYEGPIKDVLRILFYKENKA